MIDHPYLLPPAHSTWRPEPRHPDGLSPSAFVYRNGKVIFVDELPKTPSERLRELYQAGKITARQYAALYGQCTHEQIDELLKAAQR